MNWKDLAGRLAQAGAPVIGSVLAGPLGGTIGAVVGNVIAEALGTEATPEAVNEALNTTDTSVLQTKLSEAESKWQSIAAQVQAEADLGKTQVSEIGETIRAEYNLTRMATGWVRNLIVFFQAAWRPVAMYTWIASWPFQLHQVLVTTLPTERASILYALTAWNAVPASLAGVYAWGRTKEKIADMIPPLPGVAGTVQKVVKAVTR